MSEAAQSSPQHKSHTWDGDNDTAAGIGNRRDGEDRDHRSHRRVMVVQGAHLVQHQRLVCGRRGRRLTLSKRDSGGEAEGRTREVCNDGVAERVRGCKRGSETDLTGGGGALRQPLKALKGGGDLAERGQADVGADEVEADGDGLLGDGPDHEVCYRLHIELQWAGLSAALPKGELGVRQRVHLPPNFGQSGAEVGAVQEEGDVEEDLGRGSLAVGELVGREEDVKVVNAVGGVRNHLRDRADPLPGQRAGEDVAACHGCP
eukprot:757531-Hanusia_phi.AAC.4